MRIVYVITRSDAVGGASIHVRDLARAMMERGHEVTVLAGGDPGPVTEQLTAAGVKWESLPRLRRAVNPWRDVLAWRELRAALRRLRPDLVSTHTAKAGFLGRAACRMLGIPVLYTPHGWPAGGRMPTAGRMIFGWMERLAAPWAEAIICVCEAERRLAQEWGIGRPEQLLVVPNGVRDIDPSQRAHPEREPARICCVARFAAPKDHGTLVKALSMLAGEEWALDLVGDGPEEDTVRRLVQEAGLAHRTRFCGYLPDTASVLGRAQMFVLASRSEAFPRSILEAFRAGLPVVASDVGGVGEAVVDGETGLLVAALDAAALAAAIGKLLKNSDMRLEMGRAARAVYEDRYRLETMTGRTAAVYDTVQVRTARLRRLV